MDEDPELRRTLWFLLAGKRGGENRAKIIASVREKPSNLNQLAGELGLQYKTVQHHVRVLVGSTLVVTSGDGYGAVCMLSPWFEGHIDTFDQICSKLGFESHGSARKATLEKGAPASGAGAGAPATTRPAPGPVERASPRLKSELGR